MTSNGWTARSRRVTWGKPNRLGFQAQELRHPPGTGASDVELLADFNTNAQSQQNEAQLEQPNDPSLSFNGAVPTGAPRIGAEAVLKLSPSFEIGVPWAIIPAGTASDDLQDSNGVTVTDSWATTSAPSSR